MKVLLVSFNWVEYLIELGNALTERGHEVHLGLKTERVAATVGRELDRLLDPRVRYHLLDDRASGLRDPRQLVTIARFINLLRCSRADVVHLHEATNSYLPFCLKAGARAPIVLTIHDVHTHPGSDSVEPPRRAAVRRFLRANASAVILHGRSLEEQYLAEHDGRCRNTHVIPHGCYTVYRHWGRAGVPELPSSALFFGRINEYKGLSQLLAAAELVAERIPDFKIIVAGAGSDVDRYREQLERNPRCILHRGYLPNERVAEVFQQASIVVLPYLEGSQSGVVRIAYVFGKPVIVTAVGSLPESVRQGVTGLVVPPRDERALADAITSLLADETRRHEMGVAAAKMAREDLSWARIAERTEHVYRHVLECAAADDVAPQLV